MPMPNFNTGSLFELGRKTQEAFCVQHGIDVPRFYSDNELLESRKLIATAQQDLYGQIVGDERMTSPDYREGMSGLLSYRVTTHNPLTLETKTTTVQAPHWCRAYILALEVMFPNDGTPDTTAAGIEISHEILAPAPFLRRVK
ncbi:MAG: hypothetical protein EG825_00280 [Rhodocyclaceae bacterium]|nr:hypothetical protein [Rhodocyclaceae bacterium]